MSLTWPVGLAIAGAALVVIWGLMPRDWHNEYASVRFASVFLLLGVMAVGAVARDWRWILAAGALGLGGLALWMLQLMNSHSDETGELFSPDQDGIPNIITLAGAIAVLAAGAVGVAARRPQP
jgi:hypothetical protein